MTIKTASTLSADPIDAVGALREALGGAEPKLVVYFLSSNRDPQVIAALMRELFPSAVTLGCTTAGELVDDRMLKGALVASAFYDDDLSAAHAVQVADPGDPDAVRAALAELNEHVGLSGASARDAVGIVLQEGMHGTEENVMSTLSTVSNVPFVGGSAGDDMAFKRTYTCLNGTAKEGAAVLAVLKPKRPFSILKTQSFDVQDAVMEATEVDEATRTVRAFNGRPAAEAYAEAIGVPVAELPEHFMRHPLGLVLSDGQPFVRSPQQVVGTDVVFYCSVKQGMQLHVLQSRDIVADTRRDLTRAIDELGTCAGIINFHCILRTVELVAKEQCDAYGAIFRGHPTVGFSTYGESYIGHINQTSTMLLFA